MLFLLAVPILLAVAAMQRYLAIYAPSSMLVRCVRESPARLSTAAGLALLSGALILTMHVVQRGISAGGPGWLNLVVLVLAWDAIKIVTLACLVSIRAVLRRGGRTESYGCPGAGLFWNSQWVRREHQRHSISGTCPPPSDPRDFTLGQPVRPRDQSRVREQPSESASCRV